MMHLSGFVSFCRCCVTTLIMIVNAKIYIFQLLLALKCFGPYCLYKLFLTKTLAAKKITLRKPEFAGVALAVVLLV